MQNITDPDLKGLLGEILDKGTMSENEKHILAEAIGRTPPPPPWYSPDLKIYATRRGISIMKDHSREGYILLTFDQATAMMPVIYQFLTWALQEKLIDGNVGSHP